MDDLQAILGIKYSPEQQQTLRELARRANDTLRIKNLLPNEYYVEWDIYGAGGRFRVPGKDIDMGYGPGQAVYPRYIAFKFFKEISNILLSAEMQQAISEENNRRITNGMKPMDKTAETAEELAFAAPFAPNNQDKLLELLPKIILGIEHEWGLDAVPMSKQPDRINWEKVISIIDRPASGQGKPTQQENVASASPSEPQVTEDVLKGVSA